MNKAGSTKRGLVLLTLSVILSITAHAQESALPNAEGRKITLKLSAEVTKVCLGSFVPLKLLVTNHTESEIKLSKLDVWRYFSFEYVADGSKKDVGYLIVPGRTEDYNRLRDEIVSLKPGATYTSGYKFPLADNRFFEDPRKYTLTSYLYYNAFNNIAGSNSVTFETYDCNSK